MRKIKAELREQAIKLRKLGLSLNDIKNKVPVSKSTLSVWLATIEIPTDKKEELLKRSKKLSEATLVKNRAALSAKCTKEREYRLDRANAYFSGVVLDHNALTLLGAALYWAEGSKYGAFRFTNSDEDMIRLYMRWLREVLAVREKDIACIVNAYLDCNMTAEQVVKHWSDVTNVPVNQFYKTTPSKRPVSSKTKHKKSTYGTLAVVLKRSVIYRSVLAALLPKLGKQTNYAKMSPCKPDR